MYKDLPEDAVVHTEAVQADTIQAEIVQTAIIETEAPPPLQPRMLTFEDNSSRLVPSFATMFAHFGDSSRSMESSGQDKEHPWAFEADTNHDTVADFPPSLVRELDAWMPPDTSRPIEMVRVAFCSNFLSNYTCFMLRA